MAEPVAIGLRFAGAGDMVALLVGAAALVPLAGLITAARSRPCAGR